MKDKVKAAAKLPRNHVVIGMAAFLLLMAAPVLVALVDAESSIDFESPIEYDEEKLIREYRGIDASGEGSAWAASSPDNIILPSENDGYYLVSTSVINPIDFVVMIGKSTGDPSPVKGGDVREIVITTSYDLTSIQYIMWIEGGSHKLNFVEVSAGVWSCEISAAQALILKTAQFTSEQIVIKGDLPADGVVEFAIAFYADEVPYYYAPLIWASVGIVLLIAALFATDRVDVKTVAAGVKSAGKKAKKVIKGGKKR